MAEAKHIPAEIVKKTRTVRTIEEYDEITGPFLELRLSPIEAAALLELVAHVQQPSTYTGSKNADTEAVYDAFRGIYTALDHTEVAGRFMAYPLKPYGVEMTDEVKLVAMPSGSSR